MTAFDHHLRPILLVLLMLTGCGGPPLIKNLPSDIPAASQLFDQRIRERFPDGSPATEIVRELGREGFTPRYGDSPPIRVFHLEKSDLFVCDLEWIVSWATDARGRSQEITGTFDATCP
jgi:hypothetical protein